MSFSSGREAKEFLIGEIVKEAARRGVALSEIERKELYFSETDWTLPDMAEMNAAFDAEYDSDEYEAKIADLISSFRAEAKKSNRPALDSWKDAAHALRNEDHYLLVMVDMAGG